MPTATSVFLRLGNALPFRARSFPGIVGGVRQVGSARFLGLLRQNEGGEAGNAVERKKGQLDGT